MRLSFLCLQYPQIGEDCLVNSSLDVLILDK